jgi:hypothetical protein
MHYTKILILVVICLVAFSIAKWSMASGIGVNSDSVTYLSAAERPTLLPVDRIMAGDGLSLKPSYRRLTHFPPVYPLLLSLTGSLGGDNLNVAKWVNSCLYGVNGVLLGLIILLATRGSILAMTFGSLMYLASSDLLMIYTYAWSEPTFFLFVLLSVFLLALHITRPRLALLIGSALTLSLAMMTRYAGLFFLPPMLLAIIVFGPQSLKKRVRDGSIFVALGISLSFFWTVANKMSGNAAISRSFTLRSIRDSHIRELLLSLLSFFLSGHFHFRLVLICLCCGLILSTTALLVLKHRRSRERTVDQITVIQISSIFFSVTYFLLLIAYNVFVVPPTGFDGRNMSPVYLFAIVVLVCSAYSAGQFVRHPGVKIAPFVILAWLIIPNMVSAISFARERHKDGAGYTTHAWALSEGIEYARALSKRRVVYSNGIDVIYHLTHQETERIPAKVDPLSLKTNPNFEREMGELYNEIVGGRGVLIYFEKITWLDWNPSKEELEEVYKLPVIARLDDAIVFGTE